MIWYIWSVFGFGLASMDWALLVFRMVVYSDMYNRFLITTSWIESIYCLLTHTMMDINCRTKNKAT